MKTLCALKINVDAAERAREKREVGRAREKRVCASMKFQLKCINRYIAVLLF